MHTHTHTLPVATKSCAGLKKLHTEQSFADTTKKDSVEAPESRVGLPLHLQTEILLLVGIAQLYSITLSSEGLQAGRKPSSDLLCKLGLT